SADGSGPRPVHAARRASACAAVRSDAAPARRNMGLVVQALWRFRRVLYASTRSELRKRFAGSILGPIWPFLYPLLFLSAYLFLWMVVFNMRFPGMGRLGYVVYVFCGLVPFLFLSEALTSGAVSFRQNMQIIYSVIMPLDVLTTPPVLYTSHITLLSRHLPSQH